jgi:predicted nucleotidyltransferase
MDQTAINRCADIARAFGVKKLVLFGSAAESLDTAADVDFACEGIDGWDLYRFGAKLEEELGKSVDIVALRPGDRFSQYVVTRGRTLYDAN